MSRSQPASGQRRYQNSTRDFSKVSSHLPERPTLCKTTAKGRPPKGHFEIKPRPPARRFEERDNTEHSAVLASRSCVLTTESKLMPTSFFHRAKTKLMRTTRK